MDLAISYSVLAFLIFTTHITYYDVIYDVMWCNVVQCLWLIMWCQVMSCDVRWGHDQIPPATHRLSHSDHSIQLHHVWVTELSHDGCLLQELDLVHLLHSWVQRFQCHFHITPRWLPHPLVHCPKLAWAKMIQNPVLSAKEQTLEESVTWLHLSVGGDSASVLVPGNKLVSANEIL